jgi:hypothetical protein
VKVDYRILEGADHVFAAQADDIGGAIEDHVRTTMSRRTMALAAD